MIWRVEVRERRGYYDALGENVKKDIADLGLKRTVDDVKTVQVYLLDADLDRSDVDRICRELLSDPVTQAYSYEYHPRHDKAYRAVEVAYNPGVMDPVEESAKKAILDLGIDGIISIKTAKLYLIKGRLSSDQIRLISDKILHNKVVQHIAKGKSTIYPEIPPYKFELKHVNILNSSDRRLASISKKGQLFLTLEEMKAIKGYFKRLGRNPTDCELETLAQTWSEHCKHKTFRGIIEYTEKILNPESEIRNSSAKGKDWTLSVIEGRNKRQIPDPKIKNGIIKNLLKSTIMKVTEELNKGWCVSVFKDNSGIIRFDENNNICFKVETHNHPSAIEPYGGAGTGIGGVIRDPLGTGLGAKPVINTDVFCFGRLDHPRNKIPKGVLHPRRVMKGVVAGVRDYGNRMGIPTSNGAVLFDEDFVGNPLVFCGNVGIMPKNRSFKKVEKDDLIVVVGGRTGRDGIHGATFSSGELTHDSEIVSGSAVQIGNPIQEKKMTDTILRARDMGLYDAITDCGAGGLSSAVGEMAEKTGAEVYLEKVPLKYRGLRYDEIWISEAQERMVLAVKPEKAEKLKNVFASEDVEATVIGKFTDDKRLKLFYDGNIVCDMGMKFIHDGVPNIKREAVWEAPLLEEPDIRPDGDLTDDLLKLMSSPNIASKEWIIRQYDHEVQGGSVLKPLQGRNFGPGDASVTRAVLNSKKGIIVSCGINVDYGKIDPYWMAASCIDEALRQVIAVGGDIKRCAILDNFCWGNTNKPDRLAGLVRASVACYDIAKAYGVPFISGKDSLNNEYSTGKLTISIPPTLLISCISVMDDISKAVSMDAKSPGNPIYLVGITKDELGGSQYYKNKGFIGNNVPRVDAVYGRRLMKRLALATRSGCIRSCHDCSEGGLAVALAEMAFAGGLGMEIYLENPASGKNGEYLDDHKILFSESNTRFLVEIKDEDRFISIMRGLPIKNLGRITKNRSFKICNPIGKVIVNTDIDALKSAWQSTLNGL